jgi:hypothetical protein
MLRIALVCGPVWLTALLVGAAGAQTTTGNILTGDTKVEIIAGYQENEPLPRPERTVVYDFTITPDVITMDESAAAQLHRRRMMRTGSAGDESPVVVARQVQAKLSSELLAQLRKLPVPVEMAPDWETGVPANTLIVHGVVTAAREGNKTQRVMIGFGAGASDVEAIVTVSLITDFQPIIMQQFKLKSQSGKKPGAAATMGVGTAATAAAGAATGSLGDKKATVQGDAARMARAVAKQIQNLMVAQKWIAPPQPESK